MSERIREFSYRALASISRRTDKPELLAVFDRQAKFQLREEIAAAAVVPPLLRPAATFIDIGANRGQWLENAVRTAPEGRHIAFEPNPDLCDEIRRRFPAVDVRQMALSNESGSADFCRFEHLDGFSGLQRQPDIADQFEMITVPLGRLDEQLAGVTPTLIKIDVEGAEMKVLLGGLGTLQTHLPTVIFEHQAKSAVLFGDRSEVLWDLLIDHGYRIFALQGAGPITRAEFARMSASTDGINWVATSAAKPR